jgi:two-component system response regulator FlrC
VGSKELKHVLADLKPIYKAPNEQAAAASSHSLTPGAAALVHAAAPQEPASLQQAVQLNEHQLIMSAIQSTLSRLEAARKLGISPRTLRYKIAKLRESGLALSA